MNTEQTKAEQIVVKRSVFDLDSFDEVQLGKPITFVPPTSSEDALQRVGNDSAAFLKLLADGLRKLEMEKAEESEDGWLTLDEEDKLTSEPFTGTQADTKAVNTLVLALAKSVFSFSKDMSVDQKRAAKDSAKAMIKGNDQIRQGLKTSAAKK